MRRQRIAAVLAVLVLLALAVSLSYLVCEADQDCTGADCPICALLAVCGRLLRALGLALGLKVLGLPGRAAAHTAARNKIRCALTPVRLRVKLLNGTQAARGQSAAWRQAWSALTGPPAFLRAFFYLVIIFGGLYETFYCIFNGIRIKISIIA